MPPQMPVTMRGDGRGAKATRPKHVGRFFPGKAVGGAELGTDSSDEEDAVKDVQDGPEITAEESQAQPHTQLQLKEVDLQRHLEQEHLLEQQRQAIEIEIAAHGSASEYETDDSDEEGESGNEDEDEEEEEEAPRRLLPKPVFIPKSKMYQQTTVVSPKVVIDTRTSSGGPETLGEQQKRRLETLQMLEQAIRRDDERRTADVAARDAQDINDVDDTDGSDRDADYAAWKLRELLRIKRYRDEIEKGEAERQELEARRALPEDVRMKDDLQHVQQQREEKLARIREAREAGTGGTRNSHHKGGFFQDDPIHTRKLHGVIEDTQAGAGQRGVFKRSGLTEQDTSTRDPIWQEPNGSKRVMSSDFEQRKKKRA